MIFLLLVYEIAGRPGREGTQTWRFNILDDLTGAITDYLNPHNATSKTIVWTGSASNILAKVQRARKALSVIDFFAETTR